MIIFKDKASINRQNENYSNVIKLYYIDLFSIVKILSKLHCIVFIIPRLFSMYKLECLFYNNLKYSNDVSRTKRVIKGTKRQNKSIS